MFLKGPKNTCFNENLLFIKRHIILASDPTICEELREKKKKIAGLQISNVIKIITMDSQFTMDPIFISNHLAKYCTNTLNELKKVLLNN